MPIVTVSIVSQDQAELVKRLLEDLQQVCPDVIEVILTLNIDEEFSFQPSEFIFPLRIFQNKSPKGFGANHNTAFQHANGRFFCVLNPDIRLESDPFQVLIRCLEEDRTGVAAPLIKSPHGQVEDSARRFPTPWRLLKKAMGFGNRIEYEIGKQPFYPEWVAGMFMLFPKHLFEMLGGFDERYFLYYEDIDLCARLRINGYRAIVCPSVSAVHDARRESHRSWKYTKWHLTSILRFFLSNSFFKAVIQNKGGAINK